ncbi:MAG: ribbon-helix-helix domain-containing protein [Candidatus Curtissbacteria bacterium]|nr:ribbon-helix-helix domain-containing protein [Candidatus Curtissbacteria bacterium]
MIKTYLRIPDELNERVTRIAKAKKVSKAEIFRKALEIGIEKNKPKKNDFKLTSDL